ncbi:FtsK/SpoIIIE domain-containing protein [Alishewanella longhuensis]
MKHQKSFPWGIHIGNLLDEQDSSIPLLMDSRQGGFCVIFDNDSEETATNLIENVALKLLDVVTFGDLLMDVIDFSIKKRFPHLATLKSSGLYDIALNQPEAKLKFEDWEKIAIHRHHNILNALTPDISTHNQTAKFFEKYHLALLNLEHFPDDFTSYSRLKAFIDSHYEAGFFLIGFGSQDILHSQNKATQYLLNKLARLMVKRNKIAVTKDIFDHAELFKDYSFEYLNPNKTLLLNKLLEQTKADQGNERDFLSVPIGASLDGREAIAFSLGDQSKNYHAFIAGRSGSGKTTLLNSLIVGIAQNYNADEIRLYLMDYKSGVEFQIFENHPNCEKIYLDNQNIQAAVDLLRDFVSIKEERSQIFKQQKVDSIDSYNQQNPTKLLPRLILIIDEVHQLFSDGFSYQQQSHFNGLLEEIAKQGRSFGMHIILTTQSLEGVNISTAIMNQISLRISYVLQDFREASKIFNEQNTDAVRKLGKYEFIYNNQGGNKEANHHGRANYIPKEQINATLLNIAQQRDSNLSIKPIVIDKILSPDTTGNHPAQSTEVSAQNTEIDTTHATDYSTENHQALLAKLRAWNEAETNDQ